MNELLIICTVVAIPIIGIILWASGIIPGAIRGYREFKDEMDESRDPFKEQR